MLCCQQNVNSQCWFPFILTSASLRLGRERTHPAPAAVEPAAKVERLESRRHQWAELPVNPAVQAQVPAMKEAERHPLAGRGLVVHQQAVQSPRDVALAAEDWHHPR